MSKSALLVSTAVGLTLAATSPSYAVPNKGHGEALKKSHNLQRVPGAPAKPARKAVPTKGQLKEMYVVDTWSDEESSLLGGFGLLSSAPLPCKKPCTVIVDAVVQMASYYSYNQVALCPAVDGYFTNGSCMGLGMITHGPHSASSGWRPVPQLTNIAVDAGTHLGQFYVYAFAPAYIGGYQIDYHVYK